MVSHPCPPHFWTGQNHIQAPPPPPPCHQAGSHPNRCQEGKLRPEKGCWASSSSRAPPDPSWLTRGLGGHDTPTASQKKLGDRLGHWPGRPTCLPGKVPLGTGQAPHPRSRPEPRPRALQGSSGGPELGWELGARSWGGLPPRRSRGAEEPSPSLARGAKGQRPSRGRGVLSQGHSPRAQNESLFWDRLSPTGTIVKSLPDPYQPAS